MKRVVRMEESTLWSRIFRKLSEKKRKRWIYKSPSSGEGPLKAKIDKIEVFAFKRYGAENVESFLQRNLIDCSGNVE